MDIILTEIRRDMINLGKQLNIYLAHFPKYAKYDIVKTIWETYYTIFEIIVEFEKRHHKKTSFTTLDVKHGILQTKIHIANELGLFNYNNYKGGLTEKGIESGIHRYMVISSMIDKVGIKIGALSKTLDI